MWHIQAQKKMVDNHFDDFNQLQVSEFYEQRLFIQL